MCVFILGGPPKPPPLCPPNLLQTLTPGPHPYSICEIGGHQREREGDNLTQKWAKAIGWLKWCYNSHHWQGNHPRLLLASLVIWEDTPWGDSPLCIILILPKTQWLLGLLLWRYLRWCRQKQKSSSSIIRISDVRRAQGTHHYTGGGCQGQSLHLKNILFFLYS